MKRGDSGTIPMPMLPRPRRLAELTVGHVVNEASIYGFDSVLYPAANYSLRLAWGGLLMAILSFLVCWRLRKFYDWSRRDRLGIEVIKGFREDPGTRGWERFAVWALRRGDPIACVLLSLWFDPFVTTIYMLQGHFARQSDRRGSGERDQRAEVLPQPAVPPAARSLRFGALIGAFGGCPFH